MILVNKQPSDIQIRLITFTSRQSPKRRICKLRSSKTTDLCSRGHSGTDGGETVCCTGTSWPLLPFWAPVQAPAGHSGPGTSRGRCAPVGYRGSTCQRVWVRRECKTSICARRPRGSSHTPARDCGCSRLWTRTRCQRCTWSTGTSFFSPKFSKV